MTDENSTDDDPRSRYFALTRVEAYTDAVFAIAATLLVLDLTANALGSVNDDAQMWTALWSMGDDILAFVISFGLLSLMWVIHLGQFRDLRRVDEPLLWLNNVRLLFIVLIPFTTSLSSDYEDFYAGRMLLPINFFLAAAAGYLSWEWAASRSGHLLRDRQPESIRLRRTGGLVAVISGALAAMLSPWLGSIAFLTYALNWPLERAMRRRVTARASR